MVRECHLSVMNAEERVFCHDGLMGGKQKPYTDQEPIYCSAWNKEHNVCNLVLQPSVTVNLQESSRHDCNCNHD